ncbi:MAG: transketolase family protein [Lachnospiraceae bacterium]|nr:transketolase family protein [Lachnospiraceae bacterium]
MFEKYATETVRDAFGKSLVKIAKIKDEIILISGDSLGASKTKIFEEIFPERSYNVGIAEQNMVAFAAGMAYEGFIPFVSTRAPFLSMRAAEQIRTAVCYDNLPVRFVGTGGGYCSGTAGATHWALEDVAVLSSFGNMTVFETGDKVLLNRILELSLEWEHPMYVRLGMDTEESVYQENIEIELGKANELIDGKDGYFIVSGTTVNFALYAARRLKEEYAAEIGVMDMFSLKPIDRSAVLKAASTGKIVVAQDHNIIGGLGSLVSRVLLEEGISCKVKLLGCPDYFVPVATAKYLYHRFGYDEEGLIENMRQLL